MSKSKKSSMQEIKDEMLPEDLRTVKYEDLLKDKRTAHLFSKTKKTRLADQLRQRYNQKMRFLHPKVTLSQMRSVLPPQYRKASYKKIAELDDLFYTDSWKNTKELIQERLKQLYLNRRLEALTKIKNLVQRSRKFTLIDSAFNKNFKVLEYVFSPSIIATGSPRKLDPEEPRIMDVTPSDANSQFIKRGTYSDISRKMQKEIDTRRNALKLYMIFKLKIAKPIYETNPRTLQKYISGYKNEIIYSRTKPGVIANVTSDLTQYFKYWISEIFASNRYQTN
eukprot:2517883-Pleurochrysis_carterae.AAC.1